MEKDTKDLPYIVMDKDEIMKKVWTVWKYAVGSFSDERTHDHDNRVAVIRTVIVMVNVITCLIIVANIMHNW